MTSYTPRRKKDSCGAMASNTSCRSLRCRYSDLFSSVRSMSSPPGLSGITFFSPNTSLVTVKSSPSASTPEFSLIHLRLLNSDGSKNCRSDNVTGTPCTCFSSGRHRAVGITCASNSALPMNRPAKRKYCKCASFATPLNGFTVYVSVEPGVVRKRPVSAFNSACAVVWNHSRVSPPASSPGSPMNVKRNTRRMSNGVSDMMAVKESSSTLARRTLTVTWPCSYGTLNRCSWERNQRCLSVNFIPPASASSRNGKPDGPRS
mmetsp:Transcript_23414/g.75373  ORF Transcript_23414/g.75373 Transcript_23414/m.75373 type:complete len:261 (-) Transcript_23414:229-1011(-)